MFLIVGLGNPGAEYVGTRHNVGFMAADFLRQKFGFSAYRDKFDGEIAEGKIDGEKVYLLKPQTYMNGIKSIDAAVSPNYNRVRIGVGHPQTGGEAVVNHVLSRFGKADEDVIYDEIEMIAGLLEVLMKSGVAAFCNKLGDLQKKKAAEMLQQPQHDSKE